MMFQQVILYFTWKLKGKWKFKRKKNSLYFIALFLKKCKTKRILTSLFPIPLKIKKQLKTNHFSCY